MKFAKFTKLFVFQDLATDSGKRWKQIEMFKNYENHKFAKFAKIISCKIFIKTCPVTKNSSHKNFSSRKIWGINFRDRRKFLPRKVPTSQSEWSFRTKWQKDVQSTDCEWMKCSGVRTLSNIYRIPLEQQNNSDNNSKVRQQPSIIWPPIQFLSPLHHPGKPFSSQIFAQANSSQWRRKF